MSKLKKWVFIILFSILFGAISTFILRYVFGLPSIVSSLFVGIGCVAFVAWINGDLNLKQNEGVLKEFEEHEERMKISKLYDESQKKKSE
jgi:hypothetical protein